MLRSRLALLAILMGSVGLLAGCSLVGKRSVLTEEEKPGWQVSVLNVRGFDDDRGKYVLAIYDSSLPRDESLSLLQLWSGTRKKGKD